MGDTPIDHGRFEGVTKSAIRKCLDALSRGALWDALSPLQTLALTLQDPGVRKWVTRRGGEDELHQLVAKLQYATASVHDIDQGASR